MLSDPEVAQVLAEEGVFTDAARSPWADGNGRIWYNQAGMPMDLAQHLEAATGQRLTPLHGESGLFEDGTGARETISASRVPRYGNPDDEDDPGMDISRQTRAAARDAAAAMGITIPNAPNERARYREAAEAATAQLALRNGMRAPHIDFGETSRERAARMRQTPSRCRLMMTLMPANCPGTRAGRCERLGTERAARWDCGPDARARRWTRMGCGPSCVRARLPGDGEVPRPENYPGIRGLAEGLGLNGEPEETAGPALAAEATVCRDPRLGAARERRDHLGGAGDPAWRCSCPRRRPGC